MDDPADVALLQRAGRAAFPGYELCLVRTVGSTQDVVRTAARAGAAPGYCCVADEQSAGRGRQDRSWQAPPGTALLCSTLLRAGHGLLGGIPLAAGLAVRAAVASTCGVPSRLKWPNDVLAGEDKLAGVLCEVEPLAPADGVAVVLGIGVNLTVPTFPPGAHGVSLHSLARTVPSRTVLLAAVLTELAPRLVMLDHGAFGRLRDEWVSHAASIGETVTAVSAAGSVTGVAQGLDDDGALLLRTASGVVRVLAGDVHMGSRAGGQPPTVI